MATKTSASAFNSYFYQQQHQQSSSSNANSKPADSANMNAGLGNEPISDLHLKMSKKIAQLTKVIYALNSKNDEAESLMSNLKAQYEEEKDIILLDTNKRLEEYKAKLATNTDQTRRIAQLELAIKELQKQKDAAINEFESFKLKSIESEEQRALAHQDELIGMNKMLNELRAEHERQLKSFDDTIKKYETEKYYLIEDLKNKHRAEMESLKQSLSSSKDLAQSERKKIEEKYEQELNKVKGELETVNVKFNKEKQDYEQNMLKLKAFHEKELEVHKQNSNNEYLKLINNLKADLETLSKEKAIQERDFNQRYNLKLEELMQRDEEVKKLNESIAKLQESVKASNLSASQLTSKLSELERLNEKLNARIEELEIEGRNLKERTETQSKELVTKTAEISSLEASNMQKTSTIKDLGHELETLKEKLYSIENKRKQLEDDSQNSSERHSKLIKTLESKLANVNHENDSLKQEYEKRLRELKEANEIEINRIKTESQIEITNLVDQYETKRNIERAQMEEKLLTMERDLNKNFTSENTKLVAERNELRGKLDKLMDELKTKSKTYESETSSLNESLTKIQNELNEFAKKNQELNEYKKKTEKELLTLRDEWAQQRALIEELTSELESMRITHEGTLKDSQLELKVRLEKLSNELNAKWSETLKNRCDSLRAEIEEQKDQEKRYELENLANSKREELENLKKVWQTKTNELLAEISELKRQLSEKDQKSSEEFAKIKNGLERENRALAEQLNKAKAEYQEKLDSLTAQQSDESKKLIERLMQENEAKLNDLKARHLFDLKAQTLAQKSSMENVIAMHEKNMKLAMEAQNEANEAKLEKVKNEMQQTFFYEMDELRRTNEVELLTIRKELERAIELNRQKEREYEIKNEEFQSALRLKQKYADKLLDELKDLKCLNQELKNEIDSKTYELKQLKHEIQVELKNREIQFERHKEEEINKINAEHTRQKQVLVSEFKQAQEILKAKVFETEQSLREMQERFMSRESRPEDVEMIKALRKNINDREELLRKAQDEKKFFQMELVNRENNFNKMFNTAPNIGFINPLNANTKLKPKATSNGKLSPPQLSSGRLEPIAGLTPFHDQSLNPNKPLPKKFLS